MNLLNSGLYSTMWYYVFVYVGMHVDRRTTQYLLIVSTHTYIAVDT